jgi:hypothetical protein
VFSWNIETKIFANLYGFIPSIPLHFDKRNIVLELFVVEYCVAHLV